MIRTMGRFGVRVKAAKSLKSPAATCVYAQSLQDEAKMFWDRQATSCDNCKAGADALSEPCACIQEQQRKDFPANFTFRFPVSAACALHQHK
jgi:hypothetical protein